MGSDLSLGGNDMSDKYYIKFENEQNQTTELCFTYDVWQKSFRGLKEKFPDIDDSIGFYDLIVNNLKQEAKHLNSKLMKLRDNHDMNNYISTLKSLRETLDLIKKYDWQLYYSEYGVCKDKYNISKYEYKEIIKNCEYRKNDGSCKKYNCECNDDKCYDDILVTEIAVWEQNHDNQIRNHKVWKTDIPYKNGFHINDNGDLSIKGNITISTNEEIKHKNAMEELNNDIKKANKSIDDKLNKF
jgi:hypothetical protein